jgi:TolA-binding protein
LKAKRRNLIAAAVLAAVMVQGCDDGGKSPTYEAEQELFEARKLASQLSFPTVNREFLGRTLESYRKIVDGYAEDIGKIEGLELLVVTAQMELAELEFRTAMFEDAKADFLRAYDLAANIPAARINALWSAAFISHESGDYEEALRLFKKFHSEYLTRDRIVDTALLNSRYILTPVRIAELCRSTADEECVLRWLGEAETMFMHIIRSNAPGELRREARYNLVSAYLLWEKWDDARETIREMRRLYGDQADVPSLLYLEAQVELNGFEDRDKALEIFDRIIDEHPGSMEAPTALLMKGNVLGAFGRYDEAAKAYNRIIEEYESAGPENVEAMWQLALLEEKRDNWVEASLHYKSVYTKFPNTIQGMEAPLRIAAHYRETGETGAMDAAYETAAAHYRRLASTMHSEMIQIVSEEYYVRTLIEMEDWEEAARRLLVLTQMYPQYHNFKENYLMAASIHEKQLGDPERAAEILQTCVSNYSGTPLAVEAQKQLNRIRGER